MTGPNLQSMPLQFSSPQQSFSSFCKSPDSRRFVHDDTFVEIKPAPNTLQGRNSMRLRPGYWNASFLKGRIKRLATLVDIFLRPTQDCDVVNIHTQCSSNCGMTRFSRIRPSHHPPCFEAMLTTASLHKNKAHDHPIGTAWKQGYSIWSA